MGSALNDFLFFGIKQGDDSELIDEEDDMTSGELCI